MKYYKNHVSLAKMMRHRLEDVPPKLVYLKEGIFCA